MSARRLSIVWPLLIVAAAVVWLLYALGTLPSAIGDLIMRAWPVVLVLVGLMLFLGRRVRFGNVLAIALCAILVGGVVSTAYSQQSSKVRTESRKSFNQPVEAATTNVKIAIAMQFSDVEVLPGDGTAITGEFAGSRDSQLISDFQVDGSTGTFTLSDAQSSAIPSLEGVGKGKLTLHVPAGLVLDQISVSAREGDILLDASTTTVKTLSVTTGGGNVTVKLPDKSGLIGDIKTGRGNAVLEVPKTIAANMSLRGTGATNAEYNAADYVLDVNRVLISKRAPEPQMQITVEASGKITVQ
jgi:Putative adhesin